MVRGGGEGEHGDGGTSQRVEGFGLPDRTEEASLVRWSMEVLATMLRAHDTLAYDGAGIAVEPIDASSLGWHLPAPVMPAPPKRAARGPTMPSAADRALGAAASGNFAQVSRSKVLQRAPRGPIVPPPGYLSRNSAISAACCSVPNDDDNDDGGGGGEIESDDDIFGPRPSMESSAGGDDAHVEYSSMIQAPSKRRRTDEWSAVRSGKSAAEASVAAAAAEANIASGGREQWMLEAPSGHEGGLLSDLKKVGVPTAWGFQQMLPHSRAWAGLDEDAEVDERRGGEPDAAAEAAIARSREARGAPLVDRHRLATSKKGKRAEGGRVSAPVKFNWDHSEMMGAGRKVNAHDLNEMISQAQNLDSKFSRGSVFTRAD